MFGFHRNKKKPNYNFDDSDRENAQLRREYKKLRNAVEREKLKRLRHELRSEPDNTQGSAGKLLRDIQEIDKLRDYLTPEQLEQMPEDEGGAEKFVMDMIMQNINAGKNAPQTEDNVKAAIERSEMPLKKGKKGDEIDLVIARIPKKLQDQIKSGHIPKSVYDAVAKRQAKQVSDQVWKRLNSRKAKK